MVSRLVENGVENGGNGVENGGNGVETGEMVSRLVSKMVLRPV